MAIFSNDNSFKAFSTMFVNDSSCKLQTRKHLPAKTDSLMNCLPLKYISVLWAWIYKKYICK